MLGDDELAALAALNDRAAFGHLVTRHHGVIRGFLRRLAQDESAADDMAQEAFLTAYQKIGSYRGPERLRSWLLSIAYREFLAHRRRQRRWAMLGSLLGSPSRALPGTTDVDDAVDTVTRPLEDQVMDSVELTRALERLSGVEREAILLCDVYGFSRTEAAGLMGAPLGTVKSHVTRGRERLRSLLTSQQGTADRSAHNGTKRSGQA